MSRWRYSDVIKSSWDKLVLLINQSMVLVKPATNLINGADKIDKLCKRSEDLWSSLLMFLIWEDINGGSKWSHDY